MEGGLILRVVVGEIEKVRDEDGDVAGGEGRREGLGGFFWFLDFWGGCEMWVADTEIRAHRRRWRGSF